MLFCDWYYVTFIEQFARRFVTGDVFDYRFSVSYIDLRQHNPSRMVKGRSEKPSGNSPPPKLRMEYNVIARCNIHVPQA